MRDPVDANERARAREAALGRRPFDLLFCGATVVDVGTGELRPSDVGVVGGLIASVHPTASRADAAETIDVAGSYLAPGLIDMHVHFESSMLTPGAYASAVAPRGTTTVFCDPHELANVAGVDGVRYAVDASRGLPVRFIVQAPSCVPPQPGLELSGHDLHGPDIARMLAWPEVAGLAEVMDMLGVLGADERMTAVVAAGLASGKLVSGHAAGLGPAEIQAYMASGIDSDHEMFAPGDVMRGMLDHLLPELVAELATLPELPTHLVGCTDDLFAATLLSDGGMDHLLRRLIALGLPPVRALRLATYHAAYRLGRVDLGLVAAGRRADLIVLDDLEAVHVTQVYASGSLIASDGAMVTPCVEGPSTPPLRTVHLGPVGPEDFVLRIEPQSGLAQSGLADGEGGARLRAIHGVVVTDWDEVTVEVIDGAVVVPDGYLLQAVTHRHGRARPTVQLALISGWGPAWDGAIATTVNHDTHNLVVLGRDPVSMAAAANAVIASQGGVAVAAADTVLAHLALPVAGILSDRPAAEVAALQVELLAAARQIGLPAGDMSQPLMQVMAVTLACLPGPHLTDLGLIDGTTGELFADPVLSGA
jgi:adenine deaminase